MSDETRLWGGRFEGAVDPEIDRFTRSFSFDRRLARYDLIGCLAHARMLLDTGILERDAAVTILGGLSELLRELESGELSIEGNDEDIHSWIERSLIERVGDDGRRLHTGRSRNDQTAVALRLWVRDSASQLLARLLALQEHHLERASAHLETFLPGYTHLQRGQPVSLAHHLLAHSWALDADGERLERVYAVAGCSPLGAGALAGSPHPIDPHRSAELLGFDEPYPNSMWAVADRDYVVETSFSCALLMVHLSRWAEEVILWTSREVGFASLDDRVAKGSSLMPQKKNPEPAEVLRGKSGRAIGSLTAHLVQLKGLPLTYNSDLQEDKEALFDAVDTVATSLAAARALAGGLQYRTEAMAAALHGGYITATDLADALVRAGVPFRTAHERAGSVVKAAEEAGVELWELSLESLREHWPEAPEDLPSQLRPESSVRAHSSYGGPAPERVAEQLELARERFEARRRRSSELADPPVLRAWREGRLLDETLPF